MKCIDFDAHFGKYAEKWIAANRAKYKNMDEMEEEMPELYLRWLNAPADWLDGLTPGEYFARYDKPEELVDLLRAYHDQKVAIPDQLLERIVELGEPAVAPLMALAREQRDRALTLTALNLLIELGSDEPMDLCLDIVAASEAQNEMSDVACELLSNLGARVIEPVLSRMPTAKKAAQEAFLDVLCNFPGDDRIYNYAVDAFRRSFDRRALYASYLGKLGDERAIEPLRAALELSDLNYLDYIEIVNAIEALGGEVTETREFNGDPYYESLKKMQ
ncbi:MAG: hypothetical protein J5998_09655 [Clostridia bacterium]|nr:hypothetical protein [Clostridia bacterium]